MVTKDVKKHLETAEGKRSVNSRKETAILGTSYIIRKGLAV